MWQAPTFLDASKPNKYPVSSLFSSAWKYQWNFNGSTIRDYEGHLAECIVEINLESHNSVYKWWTFNPKDHIECKQYRSTGIPFPFISRIYLFMLMYFFHNERTSKARGGCRRTHRTPPLPMGLGYSNTPARFMLQKLG